MVLHNTPVRVVLVDALVEDNASPHSAAEDNILVVAVGNMVAVRGRDSKLAVDTEERVVAAGRAQRLHSIRLSGHLLAGGRICSKGLGLGGLGGGRKVGHRPV